MGSLELEACFRLSHRRPFTKSPHAAWTVARLGAPVSLAGSQGPSGTAGATMLSCREQMMWSCVQLTAHEEHWPSMVCSALQKA